MVDGWEAGHGCRCWCWGFRGGGVESSGIFDVKLLLEEERSEGGLVVCAGAQDGAESRRHCGCGCGGGV